MADKKADFESLEAYKEFLSGLDDIAEFRDKKGDDYSSSAKRINTFTYPPKKTSPITRVKGVPLTIAGNEVLQHKEYKDDYFSNNPSQNIIEADGTKNRVYSYNLERSSGVAEGATFLDALVAEFEVLANKEAEDKISKKEQSLLDSYRVFLTERTGMNEGGMAMNEQMDAVFKSSRTGYAVGGSVDLDSVPDNTVGMDPVSGNEIPLGSLPEEVRDDIPAQLSEGEYVVPADVVRYYGVKFFEDLRMQAKMGFEEMDAQGRIGGEPMDGMELVEPEDDLPFDLEDLEVIEVMEMDEGGDVARRGMITAGSPDDPLGALGLGSEGLGLGATASSVEIRKYVNEDGNVLMVMFINGDPVTPIPEGYFLEETDEVESGEKVTPEGDVVEQTAVPVQTDDDDGGPDIDTPDPIRYEELTIDELSSMVEDQRSPKGNAAALAFGAINPIMGIAIKFALKDQNRRIGNELKRRLESTTLSAQEREKVTGLLEQHEAEKPNFLKQIFGELTGKTYTPEVTAAEVTPPVNPYAVGGGLDATTFVPKPYTPSDITTTELPSMEPFRKAGEEAAAAAKESMDRKRDERMTQAKSASVSYSDSGTDTVIQQMKDRGASEGAVKEAEEEAAKVESAVEDIKRGVQRGFKKGGLASKKKEIIRNNYNGLPAKAAPT